MDPAYPTDWFPDEPTLPDDHWATAESPLRYEDVTQDGRASLLALPHALAPVVWRTLLTGPHWAAVAGRAGIIPILTRFVIEGGEGPISVRTPLTGRGGFQLAHTVGSDGSPTRALLNLWLSLAAPRSRTHGPPPEGAGQMIPVGRVFGEHVFTRPFGPPSERRVTRLELDGLPPIPSTPWTWRPPETTLALPPSAKLLDPEPVPEPAAIHFGLNHTDANQHVNSLVYPRLFLEAALRRLAAHGHSTALLARRIELSYRKPCFAGDAVRIHLSAFSDGKTCGAVGVFLPGDQPDARPHCLAQVRFG